MKLRLAGFAALVALGMFAWALFFRQPAEPGPTPTDDPVAAPTEAAAPTPTATATAAPAATSSARPNSLKPKEPVRTARDEAQLPKLDPERVKELVAAAWVENPSDSWKSPDYDKKRLESANGQPYNWNRAFDISNQLFFGVISSLTEPRAEFPFWAELDLAGAEPNRELIFNWIRWQQDDAPGGGKGERFLLGPFRSGFEGPEFYPGAFHLPPDPFEARQVLAPRECLEVFLVPATLGGPQNVWFSGRAFCRKSREKVVPLGQFHLKPAPKN